MDSGQTDTAPLNVAAAFFDELYPAGIPDGLSMLTWDARTKKSKWWFDADKAARACVGDKDVYVGCGLAPRDLKPDQRCVAEKIKGIPGLWLDVDVKDDEAHKKEDLPPTFEDAWLVFPLAPTIVVHSGHGLQGWWLFKEPWLFGSDSERAKASELAKRWHSACEVKAKERKWSIDNTSDLSRILRIPGTINAKKSPVEVRMMVSDGPRYDLDHLLDFTSRFAIANFGNERNGAVSHTSGEEWAKIFGGVGEGDRHDAALKFVGLVLGSLKDVSDNRQVALAKFQVDAWNRQNNPPLDDKELRAIFNGILRKERDKAIDGAFEAAMGQYAPPETIDPAPGNGDSSKEVKHDGAIWKLVTVNAEPKSYRLYSPMWPGRAIVLTSDSMVRPSMICREALEQAGAAVPTKKFSAMWNGTKEEKGLFSLLVEGSTFEQAPAEQIRTSYVASLIRTYLANAMVIHDDEKEQLRRVVAGEGAVQMADGSVAFHFNDLLSRMHDKPNRPTNNELAVVLAKAGVETKRKRTADVRGVFKVATAKAIEKLEMIAGYEEDTQ